MPKVFYAILGNTVVASITNSLVWFALTFWVYLETQSVIVTSVMAGVYLVAIALSGFLLGSIVDRYPKKTAMLISSGTSLVLYIITFIIYISNPSTTFNNPSSPVLWVFIVLVLGGAVVGNLRGIALSTLITVMIDEDRRDRANGMVGTTSGVSFLITSIFSGLIIGFLGMFWMLVIAIVLMSAVILHLWTLDIPRAETPVGEEQPDTSLDIRGSIAAINAVPGLFGLIIFQTFNNFLGGVFMSLVDPYGLELVSVQIWGTILGVISTGFIIGGLIVSKFGLGKKPLRTLFLANLAMWAVTIIFPIQPSIVLLSIGNFIFFCLIPVIEATEQTLLQKVIAPERQGRVFGFAQSVEQTASPITAFFIGPIAQFIFIPFMTTGAGVDLIGDWFGVGKGRGMALLFIIAGSIGLAVTALAMRSKSYRILSDAYKKEVAVEKAQATESQQSPVQQGAL